MRVFSFLLSTRFGLTRRFRFHMALHSISNFLVGLDLVLQRLRVICGIQLVTYAIYFLNSQI